MTTRAKRAAPGPFTLAIDIGGSGLKAAVLDAKGKMTTERVRVETPHPVTKQGLVDALKALCAPLPRYDRISVGFPGLIRHVIITAPNLGTEELAGFPLAKTLEKALGAPCRAVNDADMQGLAAVSNKGVEMVITLGTGFGTALLMDGHLQVHLEVAHHPFRKGKTYDEVIGERGRKDVGTKKWNKLVREAIDNMRTLVCFDRLYIGGGNAKRIEGKLPKDVKLVDNSAGILGGIKLWDDVHEAV
jgi:polyphosphate glucokinase